MSKEMIVSDGPYRVDGDDSSCELDIFDANDFMIAAVEDTGDQLQTLGNARLFAGSWQMREDIRTAIKLLRGGEDALELLETALRRVDTVHSSHGREDNAGAFASKTGGASR